MHTIRDEMNEKIDDLKEMDESSFCALLMEMREQSKLLSKLVNLIESGATNNIQNQQIIERVVEVSSGTVDKSKTVYEDSGAGFIPDVDTSDLEISVKETKSKTTNVDLDTMPEGME